MKYWQRIFAAVPLLLFFIISSCSGFTLTPVAIGQRSPWEHDEVEGRDWSARSRDEIEVYYEGEIPPFKYRVIGTIRSEMKRNDSEDVPDAEQVLKERMVDKAWRSNADAIIDLRYEEFEKNNQEIIKALGKIVRKR